MKRIGMLFAFCSLMICLSPLPVLAATGTVRVELPKEMSGKMLALERNGKKEAEVLVDNEGKAIIQNLETGMYEIQIPNTKELTFATSEVKIPMWSKEEKKMLYDITVIPKYTRTVATPKTGDAGVGLLYTGIGGGAFVAVATILYCRRRGNKFG